MLEKIKHYFIFGGSGAKLYPLAILTGFLASLVIIALRLIIDYGQTALLSYGQATSHESLSWPWLLALPILGSLIIGLLFYGLNTEQRNTGVAHVIERLTFFEGRLPWKNAARQFVGAAIAIISGHSVGREGPGVHLGATSGSLLASKLELPNNTVRILVACGAASAIATSFNTPIASVIFVMEVIMMEYHIASFIPIILSAVTGTVLCRIIFGDGIVFANLAAHMQSLWELPYFVIIGLIIGGLATLSLRCLFYFSELFSEHPAWLRPVYAGILMAMGALLMPEVMGMGYNIIKDISMGDIAVSSLLIILTLKLFLSAASIGLGIPGGMIGPTMVVGACAGAVLGAVSNLFHPEITSTPTFYAVVGMCAMMSATLKAPLAALMAMLELTGNPEIILPGMLTVVFSSLIIHDHFKLDALYIAQLRQRGFDFKNDPVSQTLRRISVANAMQRNFILFSRIIDRNAAIESLKNNPEWILITEDRQPVSLMPASDLARYLSSENKEAGDEIDLMQIPAVRRNVYKVSLHNSLHEAYQELHNHHVEALYVSRMTAPLIEKTYGVLTREMIESHYQLPINVTTKQQ